MRAAGVWNKHDVERLERIIFRKAHCVPNDIKAQTLTNLVAHTSATETIERRAQKILLEIRNQKGIL